MKILIFNWRDITHPQAGGAELHIYKQAKRWVKWGHEVTLFCGGYNGNIEYDEISGIKIIRKGNQYSVYLHAVWNYLRHWRKKCDVVIDDINGVPFFTPLYVRKPKLAIIHHLVKSIFFKVLPYPFALLGYLAEKSIPIIYKKTPFITVSKSTKEEMIKEGIKRENIRIIPNGIDSKNYKPNFELKTPYPSIVYLGRLKRYKRLHILINAMKKIVKVIPNAKLYIAGHGDREEFLKELTKKLGLEYSIKFLGFVSECEKINLLQSAWVFVTPSEKEGWGITVTEANLCGTPAVSFKVNGLKESIKNKVTGILVQEGKLKEFEDAIIKVLSEKDLRAKLARNAIDYARQYNWDTSARLGLEMLERIVNGKFYKSI